MFKGKQFSIREIGAQLNISFRARGLAAAGWRHREAHPRERRFTASGTVRAHEIDRMISPAVGRIARALQLQCARERGNLRKTQNPLRSLPPRPLPAGNSERRPGCGRRADLFPSKRSRSTRSYAPAHSGIANPVRCLPRGIWARNSRSGGGAGNRARSSIGGRARIRQLQ